MRADSISAAYGVKRGKCSFFRSKNAYMYLLLLPAVIAVFVFFYLPMCGVLIAFKDYDVIKGFMASEWVGLDNFIQIVTYPKFLHAILNTLIYSGAIIFGTFPFPVILALLFNELRNIHFKKVVQTISYMPYFLSWISVIGLFYSMFALEGPINDFICAINPEHERVNILLDSKNFIGILFTSHLWKNVGWSSVLFLAAIAGIDPTLYEAATIDGCGKFRQAISITIPCIMNTIIIVLVMSLGGLVSSNFEQVYGFQNVYIQDQTETINTLVYRQGIENGQYSLATAFGLMQGVVSVVIVFASNQFTKKMFHVSIW